MKCTLFTLSTHAIEDANDPPVVLFSLCADAVTVFCMSVGLNIQEHSLQVVLNQTLC